MQFPLIFTDLDGTLLDHHTYSFDAAIPMLNQLKRHQVPVIATTSKTVQEVINLYESLDIDGPFIVENGAAVYIPKQCFSAQPIDTIEQPHFWVKQFSENRSKFIAIIEQLKHQFPNSFTSFSQMSCETLAQVTGLSLAAAKLANQRQFGEPVLWQGSEQDKFAFINQAKQLGANILEGGRFIHVCGQCDKGKALNWLAGEYQHQFKLPDVTAIALGDSGNDTAMLEAADIAIQIKSPTHDFPKLNVRAPAKVYQTQGYGPVGWSEALSNVINFSQLSSTLNKTIPNGGHAHG